MLSRVGLIHDSLVAETFRPRADFRTRLMALYPGIPDPPLPAGTCMARVVSSSIALASRQGSWLTIQKACAVVLVPILSSSTGSATDSQPLGLVPLWSVTQD